MAFMQRAEKVRKSVNNAELDEIWLQLDKENVENDREVGKDENTDPVGRQRYGLRGEQKGPPVRSRMPKDRSEFEERMSDDEEEHEEIENKTPVQAAVQDHPPPGIKLAPREVAGRKQALEPRSHRKQATAHGKPKKAAVPKTVPLLPSAQKESTLDDYTSPSESGDDRAEEQPDDAGNLARSIFAASDDVVHEFQKEKVETVEDEGDQVLDNSLPGWGSWTGAGISKKQEKRNKDRFLTTVKGVAPEKRQDAKLDRVIVNEKRVKKNGKYLATELPHPFESRQQYERSLRLPMGPEWTTKSTFQDATKPRVLIKQGIIKPMAKPMA